MTNQIDKVIERLATEIATAIQVKRHQAATMDEPMMFSTLQVVITDELEPFSRVLVAAQAVIAPTFHTHGDFALESAARLCPKCQAEDGLRKALADLQEQKSE